MVNAAPGNTLMDGTMKQMFVVSDTNVRHYQVYIYLDPLSDGTESFTAKLEVMRFADDLFFEIDRVTKTGADTKRVIEFNFRGGKGFRCSCQQTGGTFRDLKWEIQTV